jgi:hypothetical protein
VIPQRHPVTMMATGALVLGLAGLAFVSRGAERVELRPAEPCTFPPCRAAANPMPARGYESAYVAADPGDADHIVVTASNMLDSRCGWHTTFDGGKEWIDGFFTIPDGYTGCRLNTPAGGHVPNGSVAMGPSGAVYGVFGSAHPVEGAGDQILVAKSIDGGATFGPAKVVAKPPAPDMGLGRPLMTVAAGPSGQDALLLSFWLCRPAQPTGTQCDVALFARSDDGGSTFSDAVVMNDPPAGQNPSQPAVDADGIVYHTFQRRYSDGPVDLFLAKSVDGGKSFAHSLIVRQSHIGARHDPAKLVVDPRSQALYVVWSDNRTGAQQVFFRKSLDKGRSWSERDRLLAPDASYSGSGRSPSVSVSPDGRVDVVYYHTGAAAEVQNFDDVYWSFSVDGGETFTTRQVNLEPIDRSKGYSGPARSGGQVGNHYPPTVSSTDGAAIVVWSDSINADARTNTQDIMMRRMVVAGAELPP